MKTEQNLGRRSEFGACLPPPPPKRPLRRPDPPSFPSCHHLLLPIPSPFHLSTIPFHPLYGFTGSIGYLVIHQRLRGCSHLPTSGPTAHTSGGCFETAVKQPPLMQHAVHQTQLGLCHWFSHSHSSAHSCLLFQTAALSCKWCFALVPMRFPSWPRTIVCLTITPAFLAIYKSY